MARRRLGGETEGVGEPDEDVSDGFTIPLRLANQLASHLPLRSAQVEDAQAASCL